GIGTCGSRGQGDTLRREPRVDEPFSPKGGLIPMSFPRLSAEDAAAMIHHGQTVGFSGFTPAGAAKAIPLAIAARAEAEHAAGRTFQIGVLTGASTGESLDGALARANAISFRSPYQSDPGLRSP